MQHRIDNLCYQLVQGRVCLEPLRVMARQETVWNGWRVAFHVLGASHAITLERDDICITELFTCAPLVTAAPVLAQSNGRLPALLCQEVSGFECHVRLERFALADGDVLHLDVPLANTLAFTFPGSSNYPAPVTRVGWQTERNVLRVETIHTYPEESGGVRSATIFRLENGTA